MFIKIPFQITNGNIDTEVNLKKSVDNFIDLLVSTHLGHFKSDPEFGFVFKNFSFENFDKKKGTIANSISFFDYKISESSKNPQNFAYILKKNIETYEKRIELHEITMNYNRTKRNIKLCVFGKLKTDQRPDYKHEINFHIW